MSLNSLAFNNSSTHLATGTDNGYIIYGVKNELNKKLKCELDGGVGIVKLHGNTNMIVLVGGGDKPFKSKDTVVLRDQFKNSNLTEIDMRENIKNALIGKNKLIVVLENKVCQFDWEGNNSLTKQTFSNEKGLCVADMNFDLIATLGTKKGEIALWKLQNDEYKKIEAHDSNIKAIGISKSGKYVATASEKGTLVRVFNTESCNLEYEFRRGSQNADIYDICFSHDDGLVACTSSNGTVHIFEMNTDFGRTKNTQSVLSGFRNYLPKYFSSQWGFKQINLGHRAESICSFDENNDLHITSFDGNYYKIRGNNCNFETVMEGKLYTSDE